MLLAESRAEATVCRIAAVHRHGGRRNTCGPVPHPPSARSDLGRKRSSATLTIELGRGFRNVAIAIASSAISDEHSSRPRWCRRMALLGGNTVRWFRRRARIQAGKERSFAREG